MNDTPPEKLLSNLLADSFTTDELRRFLEIFYPDTASKLPNASLSGIAHEAVMALKRSKLIDEMLIRRLEEHFPKRQADIYTCARSWGLKLTFLSGSGPSGFTVNPVRIKAVNSPSKASSPRTVMFSSGQFTYTPNVWNGSSGASSPRRRDASMPTPGRKLLLPYSNRAPHRQRAVPRWRAYIATTAHSLIY